MPFKTPIGYYREQISDALDDGKQYSRNDLIDKLPHIPPTVITGTLARMHKDGEVEKIQPYKGSRLTTYIAAEPEDKPAPVVLPKIDNSELERCWNVCFGKFDGSEIEKTSV